MGNKSVHVNHNLTPIVCEDDRSFYYIKTMEDYNNLSNEELKEIANDMVADYWVDYYKSNPEERC